MTRELPVGSERPDFLLTEGRRHYRLGVALLLAGAIIMIACFGSGFLLGLSTASGSEALLAYVIESAGFALVMAGAVFFVESRAFLRRNKPAA